MIKLFLIGWFLLLVIFCVVLFLRCDGDGVDTDVTPSVVSEISDGGGLEIIDAERVDEAAEICPSGEK